MENNMRSVLGVVSIMGMALVAAASMDMRELAPDPTQELANFGRRRKPTKSRQYRSDRGDLKRAARLQLLARSLVNPKTKVVNRMTNHERTEWSRLGCPDIDWIAAEENSRGRDYRVPA